MAGDTVSPAADAEFLVINAETGDKACLYSDVQGQIEIDNPITSGADGFIAFYAVAGRFDFIINHELGSLTINDYLIVDPDSAAPFNDNYPGRPPEPWDSTPFLIGENMGSEIDFGTDNSVELTPDSSWISTDYVTVCISSFSASITPNAGFTLLDSAQHPDDANFYTHIFGGFRGSDSDYTFTLVTTGVYAALMRSTRNVDQQNPVNNATVTSSTNAGDNEISSN